MANEEHVAILMRGAEAWNKWTQSNHMIRPDLKGADFRRKVSLQEEIHMEIRSKESFVSAYLTDADLSEAILWEANLALAILRRANLTKASLWQANLRGADLRQANLRGADLREANLSMANLSMANLTNADLYGANLFNAQLEYADLTNANLKNALLVESNLTLANLTEANLTGALLGSTCLIWANLSRASLGRTLLVDVDLSQTRELETVQHEAPSEVTISTIYRSQGRISEIFLRGIGIPDNFTTFIKSLEAEAIKFPSCFIAYSGKDQKFANLLYADLQNRGVRCWYAPENLKIGEHFELGIEQSIRIHDKLLIVLSQDSVESKWVESEVLSAMAKEKKESRDVLFPIRLDDAILDTNVLWADKIRQSRHIGDFTNWKNHDSYKKAFDRLLRDLKEEK